MGIDRNLHIGPYLKFKDSKINIETKIDVSLNICSNTSCENFTKNKATVFEYCEDCGSKAEMKNYQDIGILSFPTIDYNSLNFEDELCPTDNNKVWVPNHTSPFETIRRVNNIESFFVDLTKINIIEEIEWFKSSYQKVIIYIEEKFGADSFEIGWGLMMKMEFFMC